MLQLYPLFQHLSPVQISPELLSVAGYEWIIDSLIAICHAPEPGRGQKDLNSQHIDHQHYTTLIIIHRM